MCSYQPETLTVRAGISLPTAGGHHQGTRGQAHISMPYEEEDNSLSGRRSRTGRVLQKPEALGKRSHLSHDNYHLPLVRRICNDVNLFNENGRIG